MTRARTLRVGGSPIDLAEGTGSSQVQVQTLRNAGKLTVWLGEVGDGYRLDPGQSIPGAIAMGSADALPLIADVGRNEEATSEVDVVLSYNEVFVG